MQDDMPRREVLEEIQRSFSLAWTMDPSNPSSAYETPVLWDNETEEPDAEAWIRFCVRHLDSEQISLAPAGHRRFRSEAMAVTQVFVNAGLGVERAYELAERVRDIFEAKQIAGASFEAAQISEVGQAKDSDLYQLNVEVPFVYEERR